MSPKDQKSNQKSTAPASGAVACYTVVFTTTVKPGEPCNEFNSGYYAYQDSIHRVLAIVNNATGKTVLRREVTADNPYQAISKFRKWQSEGLPDSYLLEV